MTPEELELIRQRANKATRGSWRWVQKEWNKKYVQKTRTGKLRAKPGRSANDQWIFLLQAPSHRCVSGLVEGLSIEEIIERNIADEHDFTNVFHLRWGDVKGNNLSAGLCEADQEFIAHSREDVPKLIAALEDAWEKIRAMEAGK